LPVLPYRSPNLGPASAAGPGIEQNYLDAFTHANFPDNIGSSSGWRIHPAAGRFCALLAEVTTENVRTALLSSRTVDVRIWDVKTFGRTLFTQRKLAFPGAKKPDGP
jgi:hypothetical protein